MRIGFIGAGKVGTTLGKYMSSTDNEVVGYLSKSVESAAEAARFTNSMVYQDIGRLISDSDMVFLTVPDGSIISVYEEVAKHPIEGKFICHCSGVMTAKDAFPDIVQKHGYGYSVHSLFAVSDKFKAYKELPDVFFAIEGAKEKLADIMNILDKSGLKASVIDSDAKTKYHLAAVMSSNLAIGLMSKCVCLMRECGFSGEDALKALAPLVKGNIRHIFDAGLSESLTGPVERGDFQTINKHGKCLNEEDERLYGLLSKQVLTIAKEKHPERNYEKTEEVIENCLGGSRK